MKTLIMVCLAFCSITPFFTHAETGDKEGNGGGAMVCTDSNGDIVEAKLLDLREAEQDGLTIERSSTPRAIQLESAFNKLAAVNPGLVFKMRDVLKNKMKPTPIARGERLPPPSDTRLKRLEEPRRNCNLNGLASYHDKTDLLEYDPVIVEAMDRDLKTGTLKDGQTDLSALDFHELVYKVERDGPALIKDSIKARKLTGAVYAKEPLNLIPSTQGIEHAKTVCTSKDTDYQFYLRDLENGDYRVQFTQFGGDTMMELTYFDFKKDGELAAKFNQGLIKKRRELLDSDRYPDERGFSALQRFFRGGMILWTKRYLETFTLQSSLSPDYFLGIEVIDYTDPKNDASLRRKYWIENYGVSLLLKRGSPHNAVSMDCAQVGS